MQGYIKEKKDPRLGILTERLSKIILVILVLGGPIWFMKNGISSDFENRTDILQQNIGEITKEGVTLYGSEWVYLASGETFARGQTSGGGYMTNYFGLGYKDHKYYIAVLTIDDEADVRYAEPYRINKEKGHCTDMVEVSEEDLKYFLKNPQANYVTEPFMHRSFCDTDGNYFKDTDYTWSYGAMHIKEAVLQTIAKAHEH